MNPGLVFFLACMTALTGLSAAYGLLFLLLRFGVFKGDRQ